MLLKASLRRQGQFIPLPVGVKMAALPSRFPPCDFFYSLLQYCILEGENVIQSTQQQAVGLLDLSRALGRACQHQDRSACAGLGLSPTQWQILAMVRDQAPVPMGDLARRIHVTRSTATRLVDLLVKKRLLERAPAAEDRRRIELQVTPEGVQLADELDQMLVHQQRQILQSLPAWERAAVLDALAKLEQAQRRWVERELPLDGI